ncbi:thioredoxin-like domain-containing protein [Larkinella insperata]|uniref:Thioredoxin-like domain-containing protein n=1 Tax=Larkinella insperata TaxID=332158 RepID=A0ABW3QIW0_9BACT|nr:TlpA disulfide reductase family protein [Larkinella insperata]
MCCTTGGDENAVIEADLKDTHSFLEDKKLYIQNVETRELLDSVVVKEGKFRFTIKADKDFVPYPVRLVHTSGNANQPYFALGYTNPFKKNWYESIFYLERGKSTLERDTAYKPILQAPISLIFNDIQPQTAAAFRHMGLKKNPSQSPEIMASNTSLIRRYPYSLDLLSYLTQNSASFSDAEMKHFLSLFDESVRNAALYKNLETYNRYKMTGRGFPADVSLRKPDSTFSSSVLAPNKYNLVVFWASWCGPCRQEIPQLKTLHTRHKDRLAITSISIDSKDAQWKKALEQEKMPWNQFIASRDTSFIKLNKKYDLRAIPVWVLFDSENNLIDKQVGMDEGENSVDRRVAGLIAPRDAKR